MPHSKEQFTRHSSPLTLYIGEYPVALHPRVFSTGSCGWFANGKAVVDELSVQYTLSVVVRDSKAWPKGTVLEPTPQGLFVEDDTIITVPSTDVPKLDGPGGPPKARKSVRRSLTGPKHG